MNPGGNTEIPMSSITEPSEPTIHPFSAKRAGSKLFYNTSKSWAVRSGCVASASSLNSRMGEVNSDTRKTLNADFSSFTFRARHCFLQQFAAPMRASGDRESRQTKSSAGRDDALTVYSCRRHRLRMLQSVADSLPRLYCAVIESGGLRPAQTERRRALA
jgi:hypothetical protein